MHIHLHKAALAAFLLAVLGLFSCAGQEKSAEDRFAELITARSAEGGVSRADPGYMQYLERLSFKSNATRLAQMVSGSNFAWRRPSAKARPEALLARSNVWLMLNPQTLQTPSRSSVLAHLAGPALWASLNEAGITGLYIAPTGGGAGLWDNDQKRSLGINDDIIQYSFAKNIGTEQEYARIIERSRAHKILLGGELIPAATGIGPDFFLAVRNLREYPGLYCLIEVPKNLWGNLPAVKRGAGDLEVYSMTRAQAARLAAEGLFPPQMRQDAIFPALDTGWAATGEIRGNDGNLRRWVYRYAYDYKRPTLNFADPSNAARQIMSGSVIFQSGILANSLNAHQLAPLAGLEPDSVPPAGMGDLSAYALLLDLSADISRQSRSYGSQSWLKDELPLPVLREAMQSGADIVQDSVFSPAAEHALLTGDASLLNFMADEAMNFGLDWRKLVHSSSGTDGVSYRLPHLEYLASLNDHSQIKQFRIRRAKALLDSVPRQAQAKASYKDDDKTSSFYEKGRLYTTPAGIAALAMGIHNHMGITPEDEATIRRGHMLLNFFRALQPGIYMLSGQDATGVMPAIIQNQQDPRAKSKRLISMGSYPLLASAESGIYSSIGLPKAKALYGSIDLQLYNPASFMRELAEIIKLRERLDIARGTVVGRLKSDNKGLIALVTRLPASSQIAQNTGGRTYAISIVNFSRDESSEYLDLGSIPELAEILPGSTLGLVNGNFLSLRRQEKWLFALAPGWSKGLVIIAENPAEKIKEDAPQNESAPTDAQIAPEAAPAEKPAENG